MTPYSDHQLKAISDGLEAGKAIGDIVVPPPKKKKARNNEESRSQRALIRWWRAACKRFDVPEILLFSIPNGGNMDARRGSIMKAEGQRKGAPDLMLAVPSGQQGIFSGESDLPVYKYAGLFVEMKTSTGAISADQFEFHAYLVSRGYAVHICRSTEDAIKVITSYLQ